MEARGRWTLLGAPVDSAGDLHAEALAPSALRRAGLLARLDAHDAGDFGTPLRAPSRHANGLLGFEAMVAFSGELRDGVAAVLAPGGRPLVLGGDCALLLGVFAGLRDAGERPGLWFVDGHADFYDGATSPTGEVADMELAILTGHGPHGLVDLAGERPLVDPGRVSILGHRPATTGTDVAEELGYVPDEIHCVDARAVRRRGAAEVSREAARRLAPRGPAWLHIDLDVLDTDQFPAVSYPQPGGLQWDELTGLVAPLATSPSLVGVSIADLNPARDPSGRFAGEVVDRLAPVLGMS